MVRNSKCLKLLSTVIKITYSHSLNFYNNPTSRLLLITWHTNDVTQSFAEETPHIFFLCISDAERAAMSAWPVPLTARIIHPCTSHSICIPLVILDGDYTKGEGASNTSWQDIDHKTILSTKSCTSFIWCLMFFSFSIQLHVVWTRRH